MLSHSLSQHEYPNVPASRTNEAHAPGSGSTTSVSKNINRLLSAAVVSPHFRRLLLSDPVAALAVGYNGEYFQLTQAEYAAVTSLRVATVRDFAAQLLRSLQHAASDSAHYAADVSADFRFAEVAAR